MKNCRWPEICSLKRKLRLKWKLYFGDKLVRIACNPVINQSDFSGESGKPQSVFSKKIQKQGVIGRGVFVAAAETQAGTGKSGPDFSLAAVNIFRVENQKNTVIGIKFLRQKMFLGDTDADFAKPDRIALLILVQLANSRLQVCVSLKGQLIFKPGYPS